MRTEDTFEIKGHHVFTFENIYTGKKRISEYDNIILTTCKNMMADRLAQTGNDCNITYGAVGTDGTAPIIGNTTLGAELDRSIVVSISSSGSIVSIRTFFGAAEAVGTIAEFGLFGEAASGTIDTGTMINHTLVSEVKAANETLTIDSTITIP